MAMTPAVKERFLNYKTLASSSGTKTYKNHLLALATAYNSLTEDEKLRTILTEGAGVYQPISTGGGYFSIGSNGTNIYTSIIYVVQGIYYSSKNSGTPTDIGENTTSTTWKLRILTVDNS